MFKNDYLARVYDEVSGRSAGETEFLQAVREVLESLEAYVEKHPELEQQGILERMVEPERFIQFRVSWVDDAGKVEWITKSSYNASLKAVVFETGHFSIYGIGYKKPVPAFTDIRNHWAADNILFATSRGLLSGTSDTTFSPNTGMTRGMFVTALGRLAGVDPADYQSGKFTDVKADAYYAPYVNWAAKTGIVSGTTDTTFAPDTNINREQMAVIMKNYAVKLGYTVPKALEAVTFADNASISSWAKEAVKSMQQAGILAGKTNNRFDPAGTATRAEVATVLRRFVEIIIDPQTANGWQQNDSGQ